MRTLFVRTFCLQPKLVATGKILQILKGHENVVYDLIFLVMGLSEQIENVIYTEHNFLGNTFFQTV